MKLKIAWLLINGSHYHIARWHAVSEISEFEPQLIELSNRDASFAELESSNASRFERHTLFHNRIWSEISGWQRQQAILKVLDKTNPDIICINGWSMGGGVAALYWAKLHQRRVIIFSASNKFDKQRNFFLEKIKSMIVNLSDAAMVGGSNARDYLCALGYAGNRIFLGYDVVDNSYFSAKSGAEIFSRVVMHNLISKTPFFLAVARFEKKKNHARLLQAYSKYRTVIGDTAWPLVILGDGILRSRLEAQCISLGLSETVILPGFVGYDELPGWYQNAGCFIHPSTSEQWGLVVNEAMAAGLPVLVSNRCGCARDLVIDGRNGFTFDPYNVDEISDVMVRVTSNGFDRARFGEESLRIISKWSPQTFANNLLTAAKAAMLVPPSKLVLTNRMLLWALMWR